MDFSIKLKRSFPQTFYFSQIIENFTQKKPKQHPQFKAFLQVSRREVYFPILYLIYTADLSTPSWVIVAIFANDTAILSTAFHPKLASANLQKSLDAVSKWLKEWRIKVNETKSVQVTFLLRKQNCPQVSLNNIILP